MIQKQRLGEADERSGIVLPQEGDSWLFSISSIKYPRFTGCVGNVEQGSYKNDSSMDL